MNRSILIVIFLIGIFMKLKAQEKPAAVRSSIGNVTVFLSGAEVQREGRVAVKAGVQQVIFENLPLQLNAQSIQVSGAGNFTILGVSHRVNHLKPAENTKEVERLDKLVKSLNEKIKQQNAAQEVLKAEEEMLKKNQYIGGAQTGVKIAELKEFADYFRSRMQALNQEYLKNANEITEWQEELQKAEDQLSMLNDNPHRPTSEIVVDVTAPAAGEARLTLTYLVYQAGWTPSYDLRSTDINTPIALTYKANVQQNTGESWENVKPVFSTANPTINSTRPILNPWYLSFYTPPTPRTSQYQYNMMARSVAKQEVAEMAVAADEMALSAEPAATASVFTTVQESQTSIEFVVDVPYTIPSDGQSHVVELAKHSLPAVYEYYAVRKLEKDVFLLAKVAGWEKLNLLSGPAILFFEGKFVGESYIETRQTDEELTLSLGRDKNITVTRIRKRDFSEKQFLGSTITETREWDLTVHNKKNQAVTITVEDQIPVSTEKSINVEPLNISKAQLDKDTGKLTWKFVMEPSETQEMNVKFSVKYPKDRKVALE
jgi:uncharacterized protein (TIGR02231 family)